MTEYLTLPIRDEFIRDLYERYVRDPDSVDKSWAPFFDGLGRDTPVPEFASKPGDGIDPYRTALILGRIIEAYRWRGHLGARLNPLGPPASRHDADLTLDRLALIAGDGHLAVPLHGELGLAGASLHRIVARLEEIYCGTIGFEFMHVGDAAAREWLRGAIETGWGAPDRELRRAAAERLVEADELEQFMHRRFTGKKRFGAEGAESLLPWLWAVLARSARLGVRTAVIGGTARGRLNQMANIAGKPLHALFAEFGGARPFPEGIRASGDVTYHLGFAGEQQLGGARIRIDYCNNPSHLEAVDSVALGRTRALQARYADAEQACREVMCLMVHTDAAFAGQGVVAEVLQLSGLEHYRTGGSIHVIVNNQLGFTTDPSHGRTSTYCSDVAKTIGAPILHVNGDDVDSVLRAAAIAAEFRHRFRQDVVVDLVCFRRRGHNEVDEPSFTQPTMYRKIAEQRPVRQAYLETLRQQAVVTAAEEEALVANYRARLETAYEVARTYKPNQPSPGGEAARRSANRGAGEDERPTGIRLDRLREIGLALSRVPDGLEVHPNVALIFGERVAALEAGTGIDWALAEALAFGSLLSEGISVRLSGQDTSRGAFSHRHFILHDQRDGRRFVIFGALPAAAGRCEIIDSPLAEYATLGFEYGYSLDASDALVAWEAQFGDFANVAQVIIDQFVSSGEDKWLQSSGVVLLLPHGLEGQGPEHSSARIERFLQMCAADNMAVVNCTTPANYFHALRRQGHEPRRPLIVFTPKSLLRRREVVSALAEMDLGTSFRPLIGPDAEGETLRRIVLCSGKVYWDLAAERARHGLEHVGLVRIEQLYPFPADALEDALRPHDWAEIVWCQEEPRNMGPWMHVDRRIETVLRRLGSKTRWPCYVGRPENPSPAIGTTAEHNADQARIVRDALGLLIDGKVDSTR